MPRLREIVTTNDLRRSYRFWGGVLSLSKETGKIRHSTVTLLLTTITEVLTDAHMLVQGLLRLQRYVAVLARRYVIPTMPLPYRDED